MSQWAEVIAPFTQDVVLPRLPEDMLPKLDVHALIAAANLSIPVDTEPIQQLLAALAERAEVAA
ncbi:hypothetical protein [Gulosibacter sediminis]|nr:hypothetical protein [Gulosibacter sediminis]